jgi:hypothetical protein
VENRCGLLAPSLAPTKRSSKVSLAGRGAKIESGSLVLVLVVVMVVVVEEVVVVIVEVEVVVVLVVGVEDVVVVKLVVSVNEVVVDTSARSHTYRRRALQLTSR